MSVKIEETLDQDGKPTVEVSSKKTLSPLVIFKTTDGFALFGVRYKEGQKTPKELSGRYTKLPWAVKAVKHYLDNMPKSRAAQRDERSAKRTKELQES